MGTNDLKPPPYEVILDWLSFTLPGRSARFNGNQLEYITQVILQEYNQFDGIKAAKEFSRRPYTMAIPFLQGMIYYSDNPKVNHVLIEISGQGMQQLRDVGEDYNVCMKAYLDAINITRVDVAVDLETDTRPEDFTQHIAKRWTDVTRRKSETGETVYIGSMKSDRYCRVYRYEPPHERAHLLRVEMVHRKKYGREVMNQWLQQHPRDEFAAMCANPYGFQHHDWQLHSDDKIRSYRTDTKMSATTLWLQKSVIPAILKVREKLGDEHPIFEELRSALP